MKDLDTVLWYLKFMNSNTKYFMIYLTTRFSNNTGTETKLEPFLDLNCKENTEKCTLQTTN